MREELKKKSDTEIFDLINPSIGLNNIQGKYSVESELKYSETNQMGTCGKNNLISRQEAVAVIQRLYQKVYAEICKRRDEEEFNEIPLELKNFLCALDCAIWMLRELPERTEKDLAKTNIKPLKEVKTLMQALEKLSVNVGDRLYSVDIEQDIKGVTIHDMEDAHKENGYEIISLNNEETTNNRGSFNPFKAFIEKADIVATDKAKSLEEKEIEVRELLEISGFGKLYAVERLNDMSFLDDEPEWKEKAIKILEEYL